jgi:hypothetical protein
MKIRFIKNRFGLIVSNNLHDESIEIITAGGCSDPVNFFVNFSNALHGTRLVPD